MIIHEGSIFSKITIEPTCIRCDGDVSPVKRIYEYDKNSITKKHIAICVECGLQQLFVIEHRQEE